MIEPLMISLAGVVVIAFAWLVWPTVWRCDSITRAGETVPVRVNRVTGMTYILAGFNGWRRTQ